MDADDGLHARAIAIGQPETVNMLEHADIGASVPGRRKLPVGRYRGRHAGRPKLFAVHFRQDEFVQRRQPVADVVGGFHRRGDQFQQRLGKVGGDVAVGQGRPEFLTMRRRRNPAGRRNAQAFPLDAPESARKLLPGKPLYSLPDDCALHWRSALRETVLPEGRRAGTKRLHFEG